MVGTWHMLRGELGRNNPDTSAVSAGETAERSGTAQRQSETLAALEIAEPPIVLHLPIPSPSRSKVTAQVPREKAPSHVASDEQPR